MVLCSLESIRIFATEFHQFFQILSAKSGCRASACLKIPILFSAGVGSLLIDGMRRVILEQLHLCLATPHKAPQRILLKRLDLCLSTPRNAPQRTLLKPHNLCLSTPLWWRNFSGKSGSRASMHAQSKSKTHLNQLPLCLSTLPRLKKLSAKSGCKDSACLKIFCAILMSPLLEYTHPNPSTATARVGSSLTADANAAHTKKIVGPRLNESSANAHTPCWWNDEGWFCVWHVIAWKTRKDFPSCTRIKSGPKNDPTNHYSKDDSKNHKNLRITQNDLANHCMRGEAHFLCW